MSIGNLIKTGKAEDDTNKVQGRGEGGKLIRSSIRSTADTHFLSHLLAEEADKNSEMNQAFEPVVKEDGNKNRPGSPKILLKLLSASPERYRPARATNQRYSPGDKNVVASAGQGAVMTPGDKTLKKLEEATLRFKADKNDCAAAKGDKEDNGEKMGDRVVNKGEIQMYPKEYMFCNDGGADASLITSAVCLQNVNNPLRAKFANGLSPRDTPSSSPDICKMIRLKMILPLHEVQRQETPFYDSEDGTDHSIPELSRYPSASIDSEDFGGSFTPNSLLNVSPSVYVGADHPILYPTVMDIQMAAGSIKDNGASDTESPSSVNQLAKTVYDCDEAKNEGEMDMFDDCLSHFSGSDGNTSCETTTSGEEILDTLVQGTFNDKPRFNISKGSAFETSTDTNSQANAADKPKVFSAPCGTTAHISSQVREGVRDFKLSGGVGDNGYPVNGYSVPLNRIERRLLKKEEKKEKKSKKQAAEAELKARVQEALEARGGTRIAAYVATDTLTRTTDLVYGLNADEASQARLIDEYKTGQGEERSERSMMIDSITQLFAALPMNVIMYETQAPLRSRDKTPMVTPMKNKEDGNHVEDGHQIVIPPPHQSAVEPEAPFSRDKINDTETGEELFTESTKESSFKPLGVQSQDQVMSAGDERLEQPVTEVTKSYIETNASVKTTMAVDSVVVQMLELSDDGESAHSTGQTQPGDMVQSDQDNSDNDSDDESVNEDGAPTDEQRTAIDGETQPKVEIDASYQEQQVAPVADKNTGPHSRSDAAKDKTVHDSQGQVRMERSHTEGKSGQFKEVMTQLRATRTREFNEVGDDYWQGRKANAARQQKRAADQVTSRADQVAKITVPDTTAKMLISGLSQILSSSTAEYGMSQPEYEDAPWSREKEKGVKLRDEETSQPTDTTERDTISVDGSSVSTNVPETTAERREAGLHSDSETSDTGEEYMEVSDGQQIPMSECVKTASSSNSATVKAVSKTGNNQATISGRVTRGTGLSQNASQSAGGGDQPPPPKDDDELDKRKKTAAQQTTVAKKVRGKKVTVEEELAGAADTQTDNQNDLVEVSEQETVEDGSTGRGEGDNDTVSNTGSVVMVNNADNTGDNTDNVIPMEEVIPPGTTVNETPEASDTTVTSAVPENVASSPVIAYTTTSSQSNSSASTAIVNANARSRNVMTPEIFDALAAPTAQQRLQLVQFYIMQQLATNSGDTVPEQWTANLGRTNFTGYEGELQMAEDELDRRSAVLEFLDRQLSDEARERFAHDRYPGHYMDTPRLTGLVRAVREEIRNRNGSETPRARSREMIDRWIRESEARPDRDWIRYYYCRAAVPVPRQIDINMILYLLRQNQSIDIEYETSQGEETIGTAAEAFQDHWNHGRLTQRHRSDTVLEEADDRAVRAQYLRAASRPERRERNGIISSHETLWIFWWNYIRMRNEPNRTDHVYVRELEYSAFFIILNGLHRYEVPYRIFQDPVYERVNLVAGNREEQIFSAPLEILRSADPQSRTRVDQPDRWEEDHWVRSNVDYGRLRSPRNYDNVSNNEEDVADYDADSTEEEQQDQDAQHQDIQQVENVQQEIGEAGVTEEEQKAGEESESEQMGSEGDVTNGHAEDNNHYGQNRARRVTAATGNGNGDPEDGDDNEENERRAKEDERRRRKAAEDEAKRKAVEDEAKRLAEREQQGDDSFTSGEHQATTRYANNSGRQRQSQGGSTNGPIGRVQDPGEYEEDEPYLAIFTSTGRHATDDPKSTQDADRENHYYVRYRTTATDSEYYEQLVANKLRRHNNLRDQQGRLTTAMTRIARDENKETIKEAEEARQIIEQCKHTALQGGLNDQQVDDNGYNQRKAERQLKELEQQLEKEAKERVRKITFSIKRIDVLSEREAEVTKEYGFFKNKLYRIMMQEGHTPEEIADTMQHYGKLLPPMTHGDVYSQYSAPTATESRDRQGPRASSSRVTAPQDKATASSASNQRSRLLPQDNRDLPKDDKNVRNSGSRSPPRSSRSPPKTARLSQRTSRSPPRSSRSPPRDNASSQNVTGQQRGRPKERGSRSRSRERRDESGSRDTHRNNSRDSRDRSSRDSSINQRGQGRSGDNYQEQGHTSTAFGTTHVTGRADYGVDKNNMEYVQHVAAKAGSTPTVLGNPMALNTKRDDRREMAPPTARLQENNSNKRTYSGSNPEQPRAQRQHTESTSINPFTAPIPSPVAMNFHNQASSSNNSNTRQAEPARTPSASEDDRAATRRRAFMDTIPSKEDLKMQHPNKCEAEIELLQIYEIAKEDPMMLTNEERARIGVFSPHPSSATTAPSTDMRALTLKERDRVCIAFREAVMQELHNAGVKDIVMPRDRMVYTLETCIQHVTDKIIRKFVPRNTSKKTFVSTIPTSAYGYWERIRPKYENEEWEDAVGGKVTLWERLSQCTWVPNTQPAENKNYYVRNTPKYDAEAVRRILAIEKDEWCRQNPPSNKPASSSSNNKGNNGGSGNGGGHRDDHDRAREDKRDSWGSRDRDNRNSQQDRGHNNSNSRGGYKDNGRQRGRQAGEEKDGEEETATSMASEDGTLMSVDEFAFAAEDSVESDITTELVNKTESESDTSSDESSGESDGDKENIELQQLLRPRVQPTLGTTKDMINKPKKFGQSNLITRQFEHEMQITFEATQQEFHFEQDMEVIDIACIPGMLRHKLGQPDPNIREEFKDKLNTHTFMKYNFKENMYTDGNGIPMSRATFYKKLPLTKPDKLGERHYYDKGKVNTRREKRLAKRYFTTKYEYHVGTSDIDGRERSTIFKRAYEEDAGHLKRGEQDQIQNLIKHATVHTWAIWQNRWKLRARQNKQHAEIHGIKSIKDHHVSNGDNYNRITPTDTTNAIESEKTDTADDKDKTPITFAAEKQPPSKDGNLRRYTTNGGYQWYRDNPHLTVTQTAQNGLVSSKPLWATPVKTRAPQSTDHEEISDSEEERFSTASESDGEGNRRQVQVLSNSKPVRRDKEASKIQKDNRIRDKAAIKEIRSERIRTHWREFLEDDKVLLMSFQQSIKYIEHYQALRDKALIKQPLNRQEREHNLRILSQCEEQVEPHEKNLRNIYTVAKKMAKDQVREDINLVKRNRLRDSEIQKQQEDTEKQEAMHKEMLEIKKRAIALVDTVIADKAAKRDGVKQKQQELKTVAKKTGALVREIVDAGGVVTYGEEPDLATDLFMIGSIFDEMSSEDEKESSDSAQLITDIIRAKKSITVSDKHATVTKKQADETEQSNVPLLLRPSTRPRTPDSEAESEISKILPKQQGEYGHPSDNEDNEDPYSCEGSFLKGGSGVSSHKSEIETVDTEASDFQEIETPWPAKEAEHAKRRQLLEAIRSKWPDITAVGSVREVQRRFEQTYCYEANKIMLGGKGLLYMDPAMRAALIYIYTYAMPGTYLPSRLVAEKQEEMCHHLFEIRDRCPTSQDPEGMSVYFREQWLRATITHEGKSQVGKTPTQLKLYDEDEENPVKIRGRLIYVGTKRTREETDNMTREDKRYCLSVMRENDIYIDAAAVMDSGVAEGRRSITALFNTQRHQIEKNNMRFVNPTKKDIGEMEISRVESSREALIVYGGEYDMTHAKLIHIRYLLHNEELVAKLPRYKTTQRTMTLTTMREYIDNVMDMKEYHRIKKITMKEIKGHSSTVKRLRHLISISEGTVDKEYAEIYVRGGMVTINEISFPMHLYMIDEYREAMKFTNWRDPDKPEFKLERYEPLLNEIMKKRLVHRSLMSFEEQRAAEAAATARTAIPIVINHVLLDSGSENEDDEDEVASHGRSSNSTRQGTHIHGRTSTSQELMSSNAYQGASSSSSSAYQGIINKDSDRAQAASSSSSAQPTRLHMALSEETDEWEDMLREANQDNYRRLGLEQQDDTLLRHMMNIPLEMFEHDFMALNNADAIVNKLRALVGRLTLSGADEPFVAKIRNLTNKIALKLQALRMQRHFDLTFDSISITSSQAKKLTPEQRYACKQVKKLETRELNHRLKSTKSALLPMKKPNGIEPQSLMTDAEIARAVRRAQQQMDGEDVAPSPQAMASNAADKAKAEYKARKVLKQQEEQEALDRARAEREVIRHEIRARLEAEERDELERIKIERRNSMHKASETRFNDPKARAQIRQRDGGDGYEDPSDDSEHSEDSSLSSHSASDSYHSNGSTHSGTYVSKHSGKASKSSKVSKSSKTSKGSKSSKGSRSSRSSKPRTRRSRSGSPSRRRAKSPPKKSVKKTTSSHSASDKTVKKPVVKYAWEHRPIPENRDREYEQETNLENGTFNHRWNPNIGLDPHGRYLNEKIPPIPNVHLKFAKRKKYPEESLTTEQMKVPPFDGTKSTEFIETLLVRMQEHHIHPAAILVGLQDGKWMSRDTGSLVRDMGRIEAHEVGYKRVAWSDPACIEKAINGLDDLIPRILELYPDYTQKFADPQAMLRKIALTTTHVGGVEQLLSRIRTEYVKLPRDMRTNYRLMVDTLEQAIGRNPHSDPNSLVMLYHQRKNAIARRLGYNLNDTALPDETRIQQLTMIVREMNKEAIANKEVETMVEPPRKPAIHGNRQVTIANTQDNRGPRYPNNKQQRREMRRSQQFQSQSKVQLNVAQITNGANETSFDTFNTTYEDSDESDYSDEDDQDDNERLPIDPQEREFQIWYDRDKHTRDGKIGGKEHRNLCNEIEQILVNLAHMKVEPNNEEINRQHLKLIPPEDREHCTVCGYTGHKWNTCSIADCDGKICKKKLAGMYKTSADKRIFAARMRGGQLSGCSNKEHDDFVREVDEIRTSNPNKQPQQNFSYSSGGGGRGNGSNGGGYSRGGSTGGNPGNSSYSYGNRTQTYGGARGTSQRSNNWPSNNGDRSGYNSGNGSGTSNYQRQDQRTWNPAPIPQAAPGAERAPLQRWKSPDYIPKALTQGTNGSSSSIPSLPTQIPAQPSPSATASTNAAGSTLLNTIRANTPTTRKRLKAKITRDRHREQRDIDRELDGKRPRPHEQSILLRFMGYDEQPTLKPIHDWFEERQVSNSGLTFFKAKVFGAEDIDVNQDKLMIKRKARGIQYDGGAGNTVISPAFAKALGLRLIQRAAAGSVVGFNGAESKTEYYVNIAVAVEGKDIHGKWVRKVFITQALVTPQLHTEMILGTEIAKAHNVIVRPDDNVATMFRGDEMITVQCMPYEEFQAALRQKRQKDAPVANIIRVHMMSSEELSEEERSTYTYKSDSDSDAEDSASGSESESTTSSSSVEGYELVTPGRAAIALEAAAIEARSQRRRMEEHEDKLFMAKAATIVARYCSTRGEKGTTSILTRAIAAEMLEQALEDPAIMTRVITNYKSSNFETAMLLMIAEAMELPSEYETLRPSVEILSRLIYGDNGKLIGMSAMESERTRPEIQQAMLITKLLVETSVYNHPRAQLDKIQVNSVTEAVAVFDKKVQEELDDFNESTAACKEIIAKHCTDCKPEDRPEGFPVELWRYVIDEQKPLVRARWARYDTECTPERRLEVIASVRKIDISQETRARKQEMQFFQAQNLAHITSFEHPDPNKQPTVDGFEFKIDLEPSEEGPCMARYQRFNPWETQYLHVKLKTMVAEFKVERSTSAWNARLVLVPYQERMTKFREQHGGNAMEALYYEEHEAEVGTFYRLTSDYRGVNARTTPMIYPLPNISDIISACEGCDRFTTGDCRDAFWTIKMAETSRPYTAFSTPDGHWQYTVMPQGARNAATYWAEMIATVFRDMFERRAAIMVYQDDIGNRAKGLWNHLLTQQEILLTMEKNKMVFKTTKQHCNYMTQRILGQVLNRHGRMPDPKTLEAVRDLKAPTTLKEVRSIIGLFQYAREYIENMSTVMDPIQKLTKKGVDVAAEWDPKIHGEALEALKIALTTAPILKTPDLAKAFRIEVDACRVGRGIGAILLQEDDEGVNKPCAYYSRALTTAERRYSATELELTAMHNSILHWKVYLRNHHEFHVIVDHYALVYMVTKMGSEQQNQRLQRLCLDLQGFRFKVTHQSGVKHIGADAVSRLLRNDEEHHVWSEESLRDDWGPLSEKDKLYCEKLFPTDAELVIKTIDEKRVQERMSMSQAELDKLITPAAVPVITPIVNTPTPVVVSLLQVDDDEEEEEEEYEYDAEGRITPGIESGDDVATRTSKMDRYVERMNNPHPTDDASKTEAQEYEDMLNRAEQGIWRAITPEGDIRCNAANYGSDSDSDAEDIWSEDSESETDNSEKIRDFRDAYYEYVPAFNEQVEEEWQKIVSTNTSSRAGDYMQEPSIIVNTGMHKKNNQSQNSMRDTTRSNQRPSSSSGRYTDTSSDDEPHPLTKAERCDTPARLPQPKGPHKQINTPAAKLHREKNAAINADRQTSQKLRTNTPHQGGREDRERLMATLRRRIAENETALRTACRIKTNCTVRWEKKGVSKVEKAMNEMERRQTNMKEAEARETLNKARQLYEDLIVEDMQDRWNNRAGTNNEEKFRSEGTWDRGHSAPHPSSSKSCRDNMCNKTHTASKSEQKADTWRQGSTNQERAYQNAEEYVRQAQEDREKRVTIETKPKMHKSMTTSPAKATSFFQPVPTELTFQEEVRLRHVPENESKYSVGKKVAQYKTRVLEQTLHTGVISKKNADLIRQELDRRRQQKATPQLATLGTVALWVQLDELTAISRDRELNAQEDEQFTNVQQELYKREMHGERLKMESNTRQIVRSTQKATTEQQIEELQTKLEAMTMENNRWVERFNELSKCSDRIVERIQMRLADVAGQLDDDIDGMIGSLPKRAPRVGPIRKEQAQSEPIIVHMLESRKEQLKKKLTPASQENETPVEKAQREGRALEAQRKAQAQNMKMQQRKTEMLTRVQNNTVARLKKMSTLEEKLKKLAAEQKRTANNEFATEAIELAIDRKIEDNGDFLISQYYIDPDTQQLYQIIDVKIDKAHKQKRLVSVARPVNTVETGIEDHQDRQEIPIHGVEGAIELTTQFEQGRRHHEDVPLPKSTEEWLTAQKNDPHIQELLHKLGDLPDARLPMDGKPVEDSEDYLYRDVGEDLVTLGMLMRHTVKEKRIELRDATATVQQEYKQIVVPESMKEKLIWILHDQMGHPGRNRTTETIKLRYHWSGLYTDVMNYCKGCRYCNLRKAHNRVAKVPIMIYNYAERPNSRVHFDTAGPFPLANNGGYYILVIKDALTKWITLIPVHNKDMYTVQKAYLEHWTSIYGAPEMLITDRGTEFHNIMAKQLAELWGVRKVSTTPKNPRSDGQVENQMRTVKDMLASYIKKNQTDWDEFLPLVAQAYNTTINSATGMTPYFLMYGREMNMASEEHTASVNVEDFHDMISRVKEIQQWYWAYAGSRVVKNSENTNRVPAERLAYKPYQVGDFFYHRVVPQRGHKNENEEKMQKISSKLQFRYVGPYMVDEVVSPIVYRTTVHGKTKRVHAINMKPASVGRKDKKETAAEKAARLMQSVM